MTVPARRSLPASLSLAVKVMYAGALVSALLAAAAFTQRSQIRSTVVQAAHDQHKNLTPTQIDQVVSATVTRSLILGIVCVLLWLWMSRANAGGKAWARGFSTVLAMFGVLTFVFSLLAAGNLLGTLLGAIVAGLGVFAVVLLWRRDSSAYYARKAEERADLSQ